MISRRAALGLGAAGLLGGCTPVGTPPGAGAEASRGIDVAARVASAQLRRHIDQAPRTLDPATSVDVPSQRILDDLFEGLVRLDAAGQVVPAVAQRWTRSADGLEWVFELDPAARWSDGTPVTSEDFVYGWRRTLDPRTASQSAQMLAPIDGALAVAAGQAPASRLAAEALGPQRLRVRLAEQTPFFLYLLTNQYLFPQPRGAIEQHGEGWTRPGNMVSNGAFTLQDLRINGAVQALRNPRYREATAVRLRQISYFPVADRGAATARFLAGDVDLTDGFNTEDIDWLRRDLGDQVQLAPYFGTVMLAFNTRRPPFDSPELRLALSMTLDRDILTGKLLRGLFLPATHLVPPYPGYEPALPEWAGWPEARRLAMARELYAKAGYSPDRPLRAEMAVQHTSPDTRRLMEAMIAMWRQHLGAELRLVGEEWRVFQQNRRLGKHGLYWNAWIGDYPDPLTFLTLYQAGNGQNHGGYSSPAYETALAAAARSEDDGQRLQRLTQAEAVLNEEAPFLPVYFYQSRHLLRPYVRGWQGNVMDRHLSRDLWLAEPGAGG
ncbi:MAG: hypothetical protein RL026_1212 [Pseudomonadota bacterium]